MDKFIITISREFGSGGRQIGEKLASRLGVECYDRLLIQLAADRSGLSYDFIMNNEEHAVNSLLYNITAATSFSNFRTTAFFDTPVNDKAFFAQAEVIRELAQKNCVIIGRCADYILQDDPGLIRLFITAGFNDRVRRAMEDYEVDREGAEERIKKIDKSRSNYYKYYTGRQWGNIQNYDLVINSSFTGVDGAVAVLATMLREKGIEVK
jgi:cytidylate kinase